MGELSAIFANNATMLLENVPEAFQSINWRLFELRLEAWCQTGLQKDWEIVLILSPMSQTVGSPFDNLDLGRRF